MVRKNSHEKMVQASEESTVSQDIPLAIKLFQDMGDSVQQVTGLVDNMLGRVKRGEMSTAKGLSFLEVKYHTLLSYLINLTYIILRKCSGERIESDAAIDRLVELRTVLEKLRPIDRRLKYQIDKLVKSAVAGSSAGDGPLDANQFRANPNNFVSKLGMDVDDESEDEVEETRKPKSSSAEGVYVPPKLAPMHYDGDETPMTRQEKLMERARRRALSSSLVRELREEYMDAPTELGANVDGIAAGAGPSAPSREQRERQEYEEMYFTRLPETKEQRKRARRVPNAGTLGDVLTNFGDDVRALEGMSSGKRKHTPGKYDKKGKGKKGSKKRKYH